MKSQQDIELSVFVRNPVKFDGMDISGVNVIKGDALNAGDVKRAMAKNIVSALKETSVKRIIWITGMGIHHEITGVRGTMLNMYAKKDRSIYRRQIRLRQALRSQPCSDARVSKTGTTQRIS